MQHCTPEQLALAALREPLPDADTAHLAAHLVVRDGRLDALPGFGAELVLPRNPLTSWSHRLEDELRTSTPYAEVVDRLRAGPPAWSPLAWPLVAGALNTTEFAIHHTDQIHVIISSLVLN